MNQLSKYPHLNRYVSNLKSIPGGTYRFGFSKEKATELMLQVHNEGKSIVAKGAREEMERYVQRLHEYGLWATLAREDQI